MSELQNGRESLGKTSRFSSPDRKLVDLWDPVYQTFISIFVIISEDLAPNAWPFDLVLPLSVFDTNNSGS